MNNGIKNLFIFASGITIGSLVTWKLIRTKYEQIARDEIDSVRDMYHQKELIYMSRCSSEQKAKAEEAKDKPNISEYVSKMQDCGYTDYSTASAKEEEQKMIDKPYVISPEEFGEFEDYDTISLTWYEDCFLADDCDELVEDVEETVGFDAITRIGEYEADIVHVRNDRLKADYEISRDLRKYSDVTGKGPHPEEE